MIISRTPLRISFFGGGTDYPDYYKEHGGEVLVSAINKFSYILVKRIPPVFDYRIKISYSRTEMVNSVDEIQHPSVRECLKYTGFTDPLEIAYVGDLPAKTGLGSSSSFTVGMLKALYGLTGKNISNSQIGKQAVYIEQDMIRERVGSQDQLSTAEGNMNHILFTKNRITVKKLPVTEKRKHELNDRLMIFYTGITRHAHEILKEQHQNTVLKKNDSLLQKMKEITRQGVSVLCSKSSLDTIGVLLHESWKLKKGLSSAISNPTIDSAYETALEKGALGGKLLGAGGGGFLLLYVPTGKQKQVRSAMSSLKEIPFRFEKEGATLIYNR